jgi:hypothetical protein
LYFELNECNRRKIETMKFCTKVYQLDEDKIMISSKILKKVCRRLYLLVEKLALLQQGKGQIQKRRSLQLANCGKISSLPESWMQIREKTQMNLNQSLLRRQ